MPESLVKCSYRNLRINMILNLLVKKVLPPDKLSQVILGGQDGLVNTLGVILGVAAASSDVKIVIAGGLAACFAEAVSMGAVAYTSKRAEEDHYSSELKRETELIKEKPNEGRERVEEIYKKKGFEGTSLTKVTDLVISNKNTWLSVLLSEEGLAPLDRKEVIIDAIIVFLAALIGALIPLAPFFFLILSEGIVVSIIVSAFSLFVVGYYKGKMTVGKAFSNGLELLVIGMAAAFIGYGIGFLFS